MKRGFSALVMGLTAFSLAGSLPAQTNPMKAVTQDAKKVQKRVVNSAKSATKTVKRGVKKVAKQADIYAEAALTNLPTPEWNKLRAAYDYPNGTPDVQEFPKAHERAMMLKIRFTGANGKPAEGVFLRPKAEGVYPCALLLHGLTNNKEIAVKMFGEQLLARNIALLALDAPEHGADRKPGKNMWTRSVLTVAVREGNRNYRRALDWLTTRNDIDSSRIGLIGYSMGSIMGSILGAVDDRVSAFALCVGGDPLRPLARLQPVATRDAVLYASPSLYIEHITPRPVLFLNGKQDTIIVPPAAMILHNAAKDPKQVVWYNAGHDLPKSVRKQATDWLAEKLGANEAAPNATPTEPTKEPAIPPDNKDLPPNPP